MSLTLTVKTGNVPVRPLRADAVAVAAEMNVAVAPVPSGAPAGGLRSYRDFTYEQIAAKYVYDPLRGKLFSRFPNRKIRELKITRVTKGEGRLTPGAVRFGGHNPQGTHVIFMLMTGRWPLPGHWVDHQDGDPRNNRWTNLRETTPAQNGWNRASWGRWFDADEGLERGVTRNGRKYVVVVRASFATKEEANAAARAARRVLHGDYAYEVSRAPRDWRRF